MNITMDLQGVLALMQRNQQQIDLLTANQTELTNYLLRMGMAQNVAVLNGGPVNGHRPAPLALPAPRRGRAPKELHARGSQAAEELDSVGKRIGRRLWTAAQREASSKRMKKHWAAMRKLKAAATNEREAKK